MSNIIKCHSICGGVKDVEVKKLEFRPSAYVVIIHDKKILLIHCKTNNKYFFPGGGVELGETNEQTLKREVKEETGIEVEVEKFIHFKERFFYYDPGDEAFQAFTFFYICKPLTFDLIDDDCVDDLEAEKPRWILLKDLEKNKCGNLFLEVIDKFKTI